MIRNIAANFLGRGFAVFSLFFFIPLYIDILGFQNYSVISFTLIVATVLMILDAGLTATLSRELARSDRSPGQKRNIFGTLETLYIGIALGTGLILFGLAERIALNWVRVSDYSVSEVALLLKILAIEVGFQMLLRFYLGGLIGLERQVQANVFQATWVAIRNGVVVLIILQWPTLYAFFVWQILATATSALVLRQVLTKAIGFERQFMMPQGVDPAVLREIWRFAAGMLLIAAVAALNTQLDKVAISKLLPVEELGYYSLAIALVMMLPAVVGPLNMALLPRFVALYSGGRSDDALRLFRAGAGISATLIFSVVVHFVFYAEEVIWVWTGDTEIALKAKEYLSILSIGYAMLALASAPYTIAIAHGDTRMNNILGIASLFVTVPGYFLAVRYYGGAGAAVVFGATQTAITFIYLAWVDRKFLHIGVPILLFHLLLVPFGVASLVVYCMSAIAVSGSRWMTIIGLAFSFVVTLLVGLLRLGRGVYLDLSARIENR